MGIGFASLLVLFLQLRNAALAYKLLLYSPREEAYRTAFRF